MRTKDTILLEQAYDTVLVNEVATDMTDVKLIPQGNSPYNAKQYRVLLNGIDVGAAVEYQGVFTFANKDINNTLSSNFKMTEASNKTLDAMNGKQFRSQQELEAQVKNLASSANVKNQQQEQQPQFKKPANAIPVSPKGMPRGSVG